MKECRACGALVEPDMLLCRRCWRCLPRWMRERMSGKSGSIKLKHVRRIVKFAARGRVKADEAAMVKAARAQAAAEL